MEIRYDEQGHPWPVPSLADAARRFDGNWDADLAIIGAEAHSEQVVGQYNKLEQTQLPEVGSEQTIEFLIDLPHRRTRRALQWLGLPIATYKLNRVDAIVTRATQTGNRIDLEYRALRNSTTTYEATRFEPVRFARLLFAAALLACWAALITTAIILRSHHG